MELKADCIRDILLYLEENLTLNISKGKFSIIDLEQLYNGLSEKYSKKDIWYSVYNLHQIRFIEGKISEAAGHKMFFCEIQNITWSGHQFLNNIRPLTIWEATKSKAKQIGGMSISALSTISMSIIQAIATNPNFIQNIIDTLK